MEYQIYKLDFSTGVHFGSKNLDETQMVIPADTLFSALCQEYIKKDETGFSDFIEKVRAGKLLISDTFPFIGGELYLPKPMLSIEREETRGDSTIKKAYKKLNYIPISGFEAYLNGELDVLFETNRLHELGKKEIRTNVSIRVEESTPYRVGIYHYNEDCGIYLIIGYEDENDVYELGEIFESLGYAGIGGKRSSGLGKFAVRCSKLPKLLEERINSDHHKYYMALSVCLPQEHELQETLRNAEYKLIKRSGFVQSENYADKQMRKRDLYVFQSGSCFTSKFEGDVYDVNSGGAHAVYRYAKPVFMGV